jgi:hypothetical protein
VKSKLLAGSHGYDGSPLDSLWAYREHGVQGDSILAFIGPCSVDVDALVDVEDAKAGAFIYSKKMLHFIVEHFNLNLEEAILKQYLLVSIVQDELNRRLKKGRVERSGNDLYLGKAKLSVSIATLSPVSSKIHFGINIESKGTPLKTLGLADLKIPALPFAKILLKRYLDDCSRILKARSKVRGVS